MTTVAVNTPQIVNIYINSPLPPPVAVPENKQVEEKKEIWKSIPIKEVPPKYQVSSHGRARDGMLRIKKLSNDTKGYKIVSIQSQKYKLADLVGRTFIPKPQCDEPMTIDHIDFDLANNRVENLQWATASQQAAHQRKRTKDKKPLTSKYKGVSLQRRTGRWVAQVQVDNKMVYHEYFDHEMDAAAAYNQKAKELQGKFAVLNNIEETAEYKEFKKNQTWRKNGFKNSGSKYYGVTYYKGKFKVMIWNPVINKVIYHGEFISDKAAARKANEEFIKIRGPTYKKLNVVSSDEEEEEEEKESNKRIKYNEVEEKEELQQESEISQL